MAKPNLCLICGVEISDEDYVFIQRHHDADSEEGWSGEFCGNAHAAEWVAAPFVKPPPPMSRREEWADRAFAVIALSVIGFIFASFAVGAATLGRWIFGLIF